MSHLEITRIDNLEIQYQKIIQHNPCDCFAHIGQKPLPDYVNKRPFCNIDNGISGSQKEAIWNAITHLYSECTYDIIRDAFAVINFENLAKHPKLHNETPQSLSALRESFRTTELITRTSHLTRSTVGIRFKFLSEYKTFDGDSIRLEVPTIVRYKPEVSYQVLTPCFYIGGDNR